MLGEMVRLVSSQWKNEKRHLMSGLDVTRTLTAHQIGINIHALQPARHPVVTHNFLQFQTAPA